LNERKAYFSLRLILAAVRQRHRSKDRAFGDLGQALEARRSRSGTGLF
jgi:hypothetical protein